MNNLHDKNGSMARLEDVPLDELHDALDAAAGKKETQRLMVAILYKQGPSVPMIANWFDLRERTVYRWFDRLESRPVADAVRDEPRSGRPPKLTDEQRRAFAAALQDPPTDHGFEAAEWTPALAREFVDEEFGIEYTRRHVRRLLSEYGDPE